MESKLGYAEISVDTSMRTLRAQYEATSMYISVVKCGWGEGICRGIPQITQNLHRLWLSEGILPG